MTVHSFSIQGYRSIQKLQLKLSRINVVTGPNGCGKSNLYKAINLLSQAAHGQLAKTLAAEGGMPSILWAGEKKILTRTKKPVRLSLLVRTDLFNYEFICGLPIATQSMFGLDPLVKEEYVWFGDSKRLNNIFLERHAGSAWIRNLQGNKITYPLTISQSESILSQLQEPHLYPELATIHNEMKRWRFYHNFRTDSDSPLRVPQTSVRTPILSNDGKDLAAALQTIIEVGDVKLLHEVIDKAFPKSRLLICGDEKTRLEVQLQMPSILRPLEAREFSDGTMRYLCLVAALLSPRPAPLLILNEPETSLHPDLMPSLADLIILASKRSQLLITTHSQKLAELIFSNSKEPTINLECTAAGTQVKGQEAWEEFL